MIKIALDAMGGDFGAKEMVPGAQLAIKNIKDLEIVLYGSTEEINKYLKNSERISIVEAPLVIPMGEHNPLNAIRTMTNSSLVKSLNALKDNEVDALVTCGPTQAVIVGSHLIVKRMEGFRKPCIAPIIPSLTRDKTIILDCGANLEIKADQLVQQAKYASVYAKEVLGKDNPSVGLLNIGVEEGKGRPFDIECFNALKSSGLNFYGNVEPTSIIEPPCDILISDGFTANMVLKTMEGTAKSIGSLLKKHLTHGIIGKLGALLSSGNLKRFKNAISSDETANAMIFGLKSPLIKAHGSSTKNAVYYAIRSAYLASKNDVNTKVQEVLKKEMVEE